MDEHARTYGKLPDVQTVLNHAKVELPPTVPEPPDYYLNLLKKSYVEVGIRQAAKAADALLTGEQKDPLGALEKLRNGIVSIDAHQMAPFVHDYRESAGLLCRSTSTQRWRPATSGSSSAGQRSMKWLVGYRRAMSSAGPVVPDSARHG